MELHKEIICRLSMGNASYHAVRNLLSSCVLFKNLKIKMYKTIILSVVMYDCEAFCIILREEYTEEGLSDIREKKTA
jgi:hypothetical protein